MVLSGLSLLALNLTILVIRFALVDKNPQSLLLRSGRFSGQFSNILEGPSSLTYIVSNHYLPPAGECTQRTTHSAKQKVKVHVNCTKRATQTLRCS